MVQSAWEELQENFPPIPEEDDVETDITELDRDPLAESLFTTLLLPNVELDEMHPPTEGNADQMIPDEYQEVLSSPTVFEVDDKQTTTEPDQWFEQNHDNIASGVYSKKGCLKIAKQVEEEITHHQWFTAEDVEDLSKISFTLGTLKQYLEALSESPMFEKESGKPNKYKMTRSWTRKAN